MLGGNPENTGPLVRRATRAITALIFSSSVSKHMEKMLEILGPCPRSLGKAGERREQAAAIGQAAIPTGARQKMGSPIRQASPFLVDVTLAVVDDGDHGGLRQRRLGLLGTLEPAMGQ